MRRIVCLAIGLSLACGGSGPRRPASVMLPPPPPASSTPVHAAVARAPRAWTLIGGDLVDLGTMRVLHTLVRGEIVLAHAVADDTAYAWVRGSGGDELRAFDVTSGARRWAAPARACWRIVATPKAVLCGTDDGVRVFRRDDGAASTAGAASRVIDVVPVGARVLAVHEGSLDALDERGRVVGSTTTPFAPDFGYTRAALRATSALACGARTNDSSTNVFCADATPRVVWTKHLPARQTFFVQADDDVLVLAPTPWNTTSTASVVLRTSDGAELLDVPHRLGGVVVRGGKVTYALALDPAVTALDASGTKLWTWPAPAFPRDALRAVQIGSTIVVALYDPIATGTELFGLDATTGRQLWQAQVDSLPIAHSKYSNDVTLTARGRVVALVGHESAQEYAQTFDAATGRRLASILRGR